MEENITVDEDNIEIVEKFVYLGGTQKAVRSRIRFGWTKFKEVSSVLCNKYMSLKIRGALYKSYARSALT